MVQHGGDNAYLLFVSRREIAYELFLSHDLAVHKTFERSDAFIYFFFLVLPQYKIALPSFWMLTLPVALAAAGVLAEIFRAGVNAVPRGQVEAAQALGLSKAKITFKIVLPQAIRFIIPSLISQLVVVVKDTTVAYVVSYPDLMQNARVLITNYDALVSVYLVIAVIYILINVAINKAAVYVSHKTGATIIR